MSQKRALAAFTLIELLVVIAIISWLVSILLPALGQAREQGRAVVCLANLKQVTAAFFQYGDDHGVIPGTYWQGSLNLDWAGRMNDEYQKHPERYKHPLETSVLRPYLSSIDKLLECPTAHREPNRFFDYTVIIRMAGAKVELPWYMTYPEDPTKPVETQRRFTALPLLVEEDAEFYNHTYDDGSWANMDQMTDRHSRWANVGFLDASAGRIKPSKGANPDLAEPQDLVTRHLKLWVNEKSYDVWQSSASEFGWVNSPK